ncbi:hypothetical protein ACFL51_01500, partial [Myxococcota bacterium]
ERQGWSLPTCQRNCDSNQPPDNCIHIDDDPDCALIESTFDWNDLGWKDALDRCVDRYSNAGCPWPLIGGFEATAQCLQPDANGDGIGDQCQPAPTVVNLEVEPQEHHGITFSLSPTEKSIQCKVHEATIDFTARGGAWREGYIRPTTVGVCRCEAGDTEAECAASTCQESASFSIDLLSNKIPFTYPPVSGCNHLGSALFHELMQDAGIAFPKVYEELCRFKDVAYRLEGTGQQHVGIDWPWPSQTRFAPPTTNGGLNDLEYRPWGDLLDLRDRLSRVRVEFSEPVENSDLTNLSWYPEPQAQPPRQAVSQFLQPGDLDDSDPGCDELPFPSYPLEWEELHPQMVPVILPLDDPLLKRRPGSWVMLGDKVSGNLTTLTLQTGALRPSALRAVTTQSGIMPDLTDVVLLGAVANTVQLGLGQPAEPVVFAYAPGSDEQSEQPVPPTLHIGLVERQENPWYSFEELFGPQANLPSVADPQILFSQRDNALLLIGETADASGIIQPNTLVKIDMADGSVRAHRLTFLSDLDDYATALDPRTGRLIVVGGSRPIQEQPDPSEQPGTQPGDREAVAEVWIHDLHTGSHYRLPASGIAGAARTRAGLAIDARRRRALVVGGYDSEKEPLTDVWEVSLITGDWTFLGSDGGLVPGETVLDRPWTMYDPRRDRVWVAPTDTGISDAKLAVWELDLETGVMEQQILLSDPAFGDQIRDGRPTIRAYQVEDSAAYGQVFRARLVSTEPSLVVSVQDEHGNVLNRSIEGAGEPTVIWSAIPGEIYRLVVEATPGYPRGSSAGFQLVAEPVELADAGIYSTDWTVREAVVAGDNAYLATREGVELVSLADPTSPALVSRIALGNKGRGLDVVGRWVAFVRGPGNYGFQVIDALSPTAMSVCGEAFASSQAFDVALYDRRAFVAQGVFGVGVIDMTNQSGPLPINTIATTGKALAVMVHERLLYVAQRDQVVQIYGVNGQVGLPIGSVQTAQIPVIVRVHGKKLIVAELDHVGANKCYSAGAQCPLPQTAEIFDLTDPSIPVHEVTLAFDDLKALFGQYRGEHLLLPDKSGFVLRAPAVQP